MVDWYGTPHTEALHVVERYRLLDPEAAEDRFARDAKQHNVAQGMRNANHRGKYLQPQFTVEDEGVFTTPWTATMTYGSGGSDPTTWLEQACAENIHGTRERTLTCRGPTSRIFESEATAVVPPRSASTFSRSLVLPAPVEPG